MNIESERLILRSIEQEDEADYFAIFGNPNTSKYDDFPPIESWETQIDLDRIFSNYASQSNEQEFAVELKSQAKMIGVLSYRIETPYVFIGYHFNESFHGKGYATEAVRAYIPWLIETLHREIRAAVDPQNTPSIKVLEKLGFRFLETRTVITSLNASKQEQLYQWPQN